MDLLLELDLTRISDEMLRLQGRERDLFIIEQQRDGISSARLDSLLREYDAVQSLWEAKASAIEIAQPEKEVESWSTKYLEDQNRMYQAMVDYQLALEEQHADDLRRVHTDLFGDMGDTLQNWSAISTDAFTEFCMTGKFEFSSLIQSMIADLIRLQAQQTMTGLFGTATGTSGLAGWINSLFGSSSIGYQGTSSILSDSGSMIFAPRASGGPVSSGTPYIVGEVGPEVFVPKSSGTIVPNNKLGGAGDISIVNNINIARDGNVDVKTESKSLPALGNLIAAKTRETIMTEMRVGGLLAGHLHELRGREEELPPSDGPVGAFF